MRTRLTRSFLAIALACAMLLTTGCTTMEGAGLRPDHVGDTMLLMPHERLT